MINEADVDYQYNILIEILAEMVTSYVTKDNIQYKKEGIGKDSSKTHIEGRE